MEMAAPETGRRRLTCCPGRVISRARSTRPARPRAASCPRTRTCCARPTPASPALPCPPGRTGSRIASGATCSPTSRPSRPSSRTRASTSCPSRSQRNQGAQRAPRRCGWGGSSTTRSGAGSVTARRGGGGGPPHRPSTPTPGGPVLPGRSPRASWCPLVGQVRRKPRWFAPGVAGVWLQAVHTRDSLALRLEWDDRSESPDTAWLAFEARVLDHLASDDSAPARADLWHDEIAVQFPRSIPAGVERPYFLVGTAPDPVYQGRWTSMPRQAAAGLARGVGRFAELGAGSAPGADARFADGQWRLVLTRALATADTANEIPFEAGRAIPGAVFAWGGSHGGHGTPVA